MTGGGRLTRMVREAVRPALIRLALRCCVVAGLLVAGWFLGGSTALAGPLDPVVPGRTAPLESKSGSTDSLVPLDTVTDDVPDAEPVLGGVVADPGLAEPVRGVVGAGTPDPVEEIPEDAPLPAPPERDEVTLPVALDPPATAAAEPAPRPAPAPSPVVVPAPLVTVSSPAPLVAEPATHQPTAPRASDPPLDVTLTSQPDGDRSAPPCSTGGSTGSGAAAGPAVTPEVLSAPHPASAGCAPATTGTTRPCGLPQRPSASPD